MARVQRPPSAASVAVAERAEQLAAAGNYTDVIAYLGERSHELERTPGLALLYGRAHARVGRDQEGIKWIDHAITAARDQKLLAVEVRALNARGAAALVGGRLDEAAEYLTQALTRASSDNDHEMIGRCSNNLGIISHLRGRHAEAIGSFEVALAAFQRAGAWRGAGECRHNVAIAFRQQGALDRALAEADRAVEDAERSGDRTVWAMTLRGRVEIRILRGELELARQELAAVRAMRAAQPNAVDESEDLRVEAEILTAEGRLDEAEALLRSVMQSAARQGRPHLQAEALRDLALLQRRRGREDEAQAGARAARDAFARLGAEGEIRMLARCWEGDFGAELQGALSPLHVAQHLADRGQYRDLLAYLDTCKREDVEASPLLTLLGAIAHARQGQLVESWQWAMRAQNQARTIGDRALEVRSINVCGAIALEGGGIDAARECFTAAHEAGLQNDEMVTIGRSANNLGVIAEMQGNDNEAVGAFTRALAAYERAHYPRGIVESYHNLAIAFRESGRLEDAELAAHSGLREADRLGDPQLRAQVLAGLAEIHLARGLAALAVQEAEAARAVHAELKDPVREAEDMRIMAVAQSAAGRDDDAETQLREVLSRAAAHGRPLLEACAERDLARVFVRGGKMAAAQGLARSARTTFARLGAQREVARLDAMLCEPHGLPTAIAHGGRPS